MARPRTHEIDDLLDAAERLLAGGGEGAVTIRALAEETGAPSGSLYHAFGSRADLLGRMWLRAALRFLDEQEAAMERELGAAAGRRDAVNATVAVASVPALMADRFPESAAVLLKYRRDEILGKEPSSELRSELERLDDRLRSVLKRLADGLWGKHDRRSVETVAVCVVDLPTAILIERRDRLIDPLAVLESAIRGVLAD